MSAPSREPLRAEVRHVLARMGVGGEPGPNAISGSHLDLEQTVLGTLLLWDAFEDEEDRQICREQFDRLHVDDFTHSDHQAIFRAMIDLDGAGKTVSLDGVTDRLRVRGGLTQRNWELYVTSLLHLFFTTATLAGYVDRLLEDSRRRVLLRLAELLLTEAKATAPNVEALLQVTMRMLEAVGQGFPGRALAAGDRRK